MTTFNTASPDRSGNAMVEVVVGMFALTMMFGLLLWICQFGVQLAELNLETRSSTWSERYTASGQNSSKPFEFEHVRGLSKSNSNPVEGLGPALDKMPNVRAFNFVLSSAWDHRQIDLNQPPNWKIAKELGMKSQSQKIKGVLSALPPKLSNINGQISREAAKSGSELVSLEKLVERILPFVSQARGEIDRELEKAKKEQERLRQKFQETVDSIRTNMRNVQKLVTEHQTDIATMERQIVQLEKRLVKESDEDKRKLIEQELEQLKEEALPELNRKLEDARERFDELDDAIKKLNQNKPPA